MGEDHDLIVIGAGNAGMAAAGGVREAGWRVLVIEADGVGGTCPLRGCVPKKVLVAAAEAMDAIARAGAHGIRVGPATLDWPALMARKRTFVEGRPEAFERGLIGRGIDVVHGRARFVEWRAVEVDGRRFAARAIVVAAGSRPRALDLPGAELLITSDDVLELSARPASIAFVGGGVIAMELSHVLARAGSRVTVLVRGERPLPGRDADAVDRLVAATRAIGVEIVTGANVNRVERGPGGLVVRFEQGGQARSLAADRVVNATGRVAAVDDLDLAAAGVERGADGRVRLDPQLRSVSNPDVFFAGDAVAGLPQLSPVATLHGRLIARTLLGTPSAPDHGAVPSVVFTVPALAAVGATERRALEQGLDVDVRVNDMESWISGRTYAETVAFAKVVIERGSRRILGATLVGHGAAELIHAFAFVMRHRLTAGDLADAVYAYPTFHADLKYLV